jgi:hypothetical protein
MAAPMLPRVPPADIGDCGGSTVVFCLSRAMRRGAARHVELLRPLPQPRGAACQPMPFRYPQPIPEVHGSGCRRDAIPGRLRVLQNATRGGARCCANPAFPVGTATATLRPAVAAGDRWIEADLHRARAPIGILCARASRRLRASEQGAGGRIERAAPVRGVVGAMHVSRRIVRMGRVRPSRPVRRRPRTLSSPGGLMQPNRAPARMNGQPIRSDFQSV